MYRKVTRNAQRKMRRESPLRSAHTRLGLAGALIVGALLLWLAHRDWLPHANETLLGTSPDCFKNYSTSIYHIRHDSLFAEYRGMNYPMGEHVLFTDNQPLLTELLKFYHERIRSIEGREIGILNIILLLSQLLVCGGSEFGRHFFVAAIQQDQCALRAFAPLDYSAAAVAAVPI